MMRMFTSRRKIAIGMLSILSINILAPSIGCALTSGPAQPEMKGFQTASVSDMVDLQTGELKYNIPLLDIDGYPINMSYQSGTNIDDEASWVGLGWSLNPGAINRQVRGIPDDFAGDTVETDHYVKPKITVGGRLTGKFEFRGISAGGTFNFGIFSDNYTGIGAELGVNAGISYAFPNDGLLTAGLGAGVLSNTQSGVDASFSPYVSLSIKQNTDNNLTINAGLSGSFGYNTRSGMKSLTLGSSFGASEKVDDESYGNSYNVFGSSISYNTEPISPSIQVPYTSDYSSYSFDVGFAAEASFTSLGGTGYKNVRQVKTVQNLKPAYGFLYAEQGKNNPDAVMDFIREKDNPVIPELPNLALPVHTPDIWSYTSQTGSGQFRFYRGTGAFFDNQADDASTVSTTGGDIGAGAWAHAGFTYYNQNAKTSTHKWSNSNAYLPNGNFQNASTTNPSAEHVYFRQVGEKGIEDQAMNTQFAGTQAVKIATQGMGAVSAFRNAGNSSITVAGPIAKASRRPNRTVISYLTAAEASAGPTKMNPNYALKDSNSYASLTATPTTGDSVNIKDVLVPGSVYIHKPNHISKITVTDDGGKRMVYGIPVYNISQDEYSFAVDSARDANKLVNTVPDLSAPNTDTYGIDNFYHKEHKSSYATSYLLTAILSPDYVDKTGNGITDDDLGTAIKFNYSKLPYYYKWRTPYIKASSNRGLLADPDDNKGSIVYGTKEIWYIQSIETKTKVAYFITQDRRDALGVADWKTGNSDATNKQRYLKEIRLYSKADMTRPIKVVKFAYTYELCRGIPNSADAGTTDALNGGKLTLSRVWFEYGNASKGKLHPYIFTYNKTTSKYATAPIYAYSSTDRWGTYKPQTENPSHMENELYPYTNQDTTYTNGNVALWHLSKINLPTGGIININYESGDYAYVQDQKAMTMSGISAMIKDTAGTATTALNQAIGLKLNIGTDTVPPPNIDVTAWFKNTFLDGSNYMYTKMFVNMANNNYTASNSMPYDMVPTYCQISSVKIKAGVARVMFTPVTESGVTVNPISISAWQRLKNEYPRYAYPGFDNRVKTNSSNVLAAVSAIINAAKNLTELEKNFYQKANSRGYASQVALPDCFVKLTKINRFKLGGPARVKKILISDTWKTSSNTSATSASYGQQYTYTTTENGKTISSGVATYEPSIGNDENALKQPVPYIEHIKGAINNYFDLELPFGESFYPAPSISYGKVTVNDLGADGTPSTKTGYIVNEFYTAKDFPVKVTTLPLNSYHYKPANYYSLMRSSSDDELLMSQGYSIEVNDMQGKPKATRVFNQSGAEISSTVYTYSAQDNGGVMSLNNNVQVIDPVTLQLSTKTLSRDIDFFTDLREQETSNKGTAINVGADVFPIPPFLPFFALPHVPINQNDDYKLFRSACAVKVIQTYGILSKVVKTENGSSITTENIAYDQLTGEALVTRTNNEFKKNIYSVNIPAYWAYNGMGAAYQNLGVLLSSFTTNANGEIGPYTSYLHSGDELMDTGDGKIYWVIENQAASGSGTTKKLIARDGTLKTSYAPALLKIVRSGFRNMLNANTTTLVCLNSPFTADNHLQLISNGNLGNVLKVINASATTFDESWGVKANCSSSYVTVPFVSFINSNPVNRIYLAYTEDFKNTDVDYDLAVLDTSYFKTYTHMSASTWQSIPAELNGFPKYYYSVDTCITINETKQYNIGGAGITVYIDGQPWLDYIYYESGNPDHWAWTIACNRPSGYLTAGKHKLTLTFPGYFWVGSRTLDNNLGAEIYDNSLEELSSKDTTGENIHVIFNVKGLKNNPYVRSSYLDSTRMVYVYHYHHPDGTPFDACETIPADAFKNTSITNPFISGFLGNWRPYQTKVFQQSRNYAYSGNFNQGSVNVKDAGYINNFYSYWYYNTGASTWQANPNGTRWLTANTVTLYDKYGQQLENKDALGRFSAANFDFNGELPSAVASNAMNREIYAASLEDGYFTPGSSANTDTCNVREFIQPSTKLTLKQLAVNTIAHSGNYSAQLPIGGVTLSTIYDTVSQKSVPYLALDASKQYITQTTTGLYPNGFEPYPGKQYIFDAWVNDGLPNDRSVNLKLSLNSTNVPLKCKAVVEGWKLVEGTIDLSSFVGSGMLNISIVPNSGSTIYIDDIRMHPFDAQMKTYAYDDKTMRLMAEIDENGFTTFYEYDDEGLLIRVKKETEKGIMTLKESRSTYRRNYKTP